MVLKLTGFANLIPQLQCLTYDTIIQLNMNRKAIKIQPAINTNENTKQTYIPPTKPIMSNELSFTPREPLFSHSINNIGQNLDNWYICFNPSCTFSYTRIFQMSHPHKNVEICRNWIVNIQQLVTCLNYNEQEHLIKIQNSNITKCSTSIELKVGQSSMIENLQAWGMIKKVDWGQYFQKIKTIILQKIHQEVDNMLLRVKNKIDQYRSDEIIQCLKELSCNIYNKQKSDIEMRKFIEHIIETYINEISHKQIRIKCLNIEQIEMGGLISLTSAIEQKILTEIEHDLKQEIVNQKNHDDFKTFMQDNRSPFNKFEQISSICGKKHDGFAIKHKRVNLKCPFCTYHEKMKHSTSMSEQQLKILKKELVSGMLNHFFNCHYSFIFSKYEQKKLKKIPQHFCKELTFQQFLNDLQTGKYKRLHIIDKESGISSQMNKQELGIYQLQILSKSNKAMARNRHLLTVDRKCTQFMIFYVVVHVCLITNWFDIGSVSIVSKSLSTDKAINVIQILNRKADKVDKQQQKKYEKDNLTLTNFFNLSNKQSLIKQSQKVQSQQTHNLISQVKIENQQNAVQQDDQFQYQQLPQHLQHKFLLPQENQDELEDGELYSAELNQSLSEQKGNILMNDVVRHTSEIFKMEKR